MSEEDARWIVERPAYMRETEPLARPDAWKSPAPIRVDPAEQARNREHFMKNEGRSQAWRKRPHPTGPLADDQRKVG